LKNDENIINIINKYNLSNIILLFYNFYENNKIFNKGGAISYCQKETIERIL